MGFLDDVKGRFDELGDKAAEVIDDIKDKVGGGDTETASSSDTESVLPQDAPLPDEPIAEPAEDVQAAVGDIPLPDADPPLDEAVSDPVADLGPVDEPVDEAPRTPNGTDSFRPGSSIS